MDLPTNKLGSRLAVTRATGLASERKRLAERSMTVVCKRRKVLEIAKLKISLGESY